MGGRLPGGDCHNHLHLQALPAFIRFPYGIDSPCPVCHPAGYRHSVPSVPSPYGLSPVHRNGNRRRPQAATGNRITGPETWS